MDPVQAPTPAPAATSPDVQTQVVQCEASKEFCGKLRERRARGDHSPVTSQEVRAIAEKHHAPRGVGGQEDLKDVVAEPRTGEELGRHCRGMHRILDNAKKNGLITEDQATQIENLKDRRKRFELCRELAKKNDIAHNSDAMLDDAHHQGLLSLADANRLRGEIHQQLQTETKAFLVAEGIIEKSLEKQESNISPTANLDLSRLSSADQSRVLRQPTREQQLALLDQLIAEHEAKKGLPKSQGQTLA